MFLLRSPELALHTGADEGLRQLSADRGLSEDGRPLLPAGRREEGPGRGSQALS